MTLLLREIGRFLVETGVWLLAMAIVAAAAAAPILWARLRRLVPQDLGLAILGAVALAAIAHRVGIAAWTPDIGGRPLPLVWVAIGAALTAGALVYTRLERPTP